MNSRRFVLPLVVAGMIACSPPGGKVLVTKAPDTDHIPVTIAVYPLLTTQPIKQVVRERIVPRTFSWYSSPGNGGSPGSDSRSGIYISPPTETKLVVTMQSQMFSDLLAADLAYAGFKLKQLPVETPLADDEDDAQEFFVSMELLDRLREEFGLEAVLLGNVYFVPDKYEPNGYRVRAAYIKLVDVENLDVICHVSVEHGYYGAEMTDTVAELAEKLATMSGNEAP